MSDTRLPGPALRRLKSLGQLLKPVVHIGKSGLSDALMASVDQALADHELIKVKFDALKEQKKILVTELASRSQSHLVQRVGNVAVLYRQQVDESKRKITLPTDLGRPTAGEDASTEEEGGEQ
ncbi:MAG: YhbY family RNA-binding protein [Verrucomicrobiales bacterium]|nr:YhbY family RNA-binding protein [Verrucomicrobiales bacterium]